MAEELKENGGSLKTNLEWCGTPQQTQAENKGASMNSSFVFFSILIYL